jgi:CHRD domain
MRTTTKYLAVIGTAVVSATVIAVGAANAGGNAETPEAMGSGSLVALLNGTGEVDDAGTPNQGDLDAAGYAIVEVDRPGRQVCVRDLRTGGVDGQIHLFHIHSGVEGQNGPVVVDFVPLLATGGRGCVPVADKTLLSDIAAFPAEYYVNVHSTPDFPAGAVRGQLHEVVEPITPGAPPPETSAPDTTAPDTTAPDTMPDTTAPDTTESPDTTAADTTAPPSSEPYDSSAP